LVTSTGYKKGRHKNILQIAAWLALITKIWAGRYRLLPLLANYRCNLGINNTKRTAPHVAQHKREKSTYAYKENPTS
jgi:hypothetical protein